MIQLTAGAIFVGMFILIVSDKIKRHYVTLGCGLLTIIVVFGLQMRSFHAIKSTLNVHSLFKTEFWYHIGDSGGSSSGIDWATIIFIAGMMIMVEGMAHVGFFRWLCMEIAKIVKYRTIPIFITFMIMSAGLAMFIDSITVILFLAAVTIELAQLLKFNPVPMILAEIFCANLGGSATMCGDPPNIIIGSSLGYSFADFITNTGLMAGISLIAIVFYFYFAFRKELKSNPKNTVDPSTFPKPKDAILDFKGFIISCIIFFIAIILLITHAQTGLSVASIGLFIAIITLIASGKNALKLLKKVDYETLLFFIGLFIVVGALEETKVLEAVAELIGKISGGNATLIILIIIWVSAGASAIIDNIPFAATMVPVIRTLAATQGIDLSVMAWALAMGTDVGGSATPIGACANVVGTSVAAKEGYPIGWGKYCKTAIPATIIVLVISTATILIRYF